MEEVEKPKSTQEHVSISVDAHPSKPKQSPDESQLPTSEEKSQIHRTTHRRLLHSKTKARFVEFNVPSCTTKSSTIAQDHHHPASDSEEEEEPIEVHENTYDEEEEKRKKHLLSFWNVTKGSAVVILTAALVLSLSLPSLSHQRFWGLTIWKWCLTLLVVFCGHFVAGWIVTFTVSLIELNFMLREKVLYFIYGLRRGVQNCVWLSVVLLTWALVFDSDVEASLHYRRILNKITRLLIAILVGSFLWLVKIVVVKMLALSFHVSTFFDRMKESVFHQHILDTLMGEPLAEISRQETMKKKSMGRSWSSPAKLVTGSMSRRQEGKIDMERLRQLSRGSASAWSVRDLVSHVMTKGLSTLSKAADETLEKADRKTEKEEEIKSEYAARLAAGKIFDNVDRNKNKYVDFDDLSQFLKKEEIRTMFPIFQADESVKIKRSDFTKWVVKAYKERKSLAHALNDTKTAVQQLHKLASCVVLAIIIVVTLLIMGVANTKVVLLVLSQLLLVVFIFGNTCKTIFESIIFVFVMHPFDVGDRVVIDGTMMIVDEMNILSTIFLRFDNEKIYYPNAVLLTKPISNYYRSPEMGDNIEFSIDFRTSEDVFNKMKAAICEYIEGNPKHWQPKHSVIVKEIENVNKMKITLYVLHTMNFQDFPERNNRRSELLFQLKRIFERLEIKYRLLPQELHLTQYNVAMAGL